MKTINKTITIALVLNIALLLFLAIRGPLKNNSTTVIISTDTMYQDTGTHTVQFKPVPCEIVHDSVWQYFPVDTDKILQDYFSKVTYDSTLVDDTSMYLKYCALITKNRIENIKFDYANRRPTTIIQNLPMAVIPRNQFFIYARAQFIHNSDLHIGADWLRDKNIYGLDYSPFSKSVSIKYGLLLYKW